MKRGAILFLVAAVLTSFTLSNVNAWPEEEYLCLVSPFSLDYTSCYDSSGNLKFDEKEMINLFFGASDLVSPINNNLAKMQLASQEECEGRAPLVSGESSEQWYYEKGGCKLFSSEWFNLPLGWNEYCSKPSDSPCQLSSDLIRIKNPANYKDEKNKCEAYKKGEQYYCYQNVQWKEWNSVGICTASLKPEGSPCLLNNGKCDSKGECIPLPGKTEDKDKDETSVMTFKDVTYKIKESFNDKYGQPWGIKVPEIDETSAKYDCDDENSNINSTSPWYKMSLNGAVPLKVDFAPPYYELVWDFDMYKPVPGYKETTLKERGFTPSGQVSPFDDIGIIVRFPNTHKTCTSIWNGPREVELLIDGEVFYTYERKDLRTIMPSPAKIGQSQEYAVIIKGWPDGIIPANNDFVSMETLIQAIALKKKIVFRLKDSDLYDSTKEYQKDFPVEMTDCVHVSGSGENRIVNVRSTNFAQNIKFEAKDFVEEILKVKREGFEKIQPLAKYNASFSHYIDLKKAKIPASTWFANYGKKNWLVPDENPYLPLDLKNSCKGVFKVAVAYTSIHGGHALDEGINLGDNILEQEDVETYIHEFGHAFGLLDDEYLLDASWESLLYNHNCRKTAFSPKTYAGCTVSSYQRSSVNSIMRDHWLWPKFNVLSCSYILVALKGGVPEDYTSECTLIGAIKPEDRCAIDSNCGTKRFCKNGKCSTRP